MAAFDPLRTLASRRYGLPVGSRSREIEGVLERHHAWLFLKTDAGHRWRLDVDEQRVRGLLDLRVKVTGSLDGNTLKVEGVHRA